MKHLSVAEKIMRVMTILDGIGVRQLTVEHSNLFRGTNSGLTAITKTLQSSLTVEMWTYVHAYRGITLLLGACTD